MKYKTFQEFEQALDAIKPEEFERSPLDYDHDGFSAAYNAAWDAAPKKWQKKYTKKHHSTFPLFDRRREGELIPHILWGWNHKAWYSWMIKRPFPHYWNRLACTVNRKHSLFPDHQNPAIATCTNCGAHRPLPPDFLTPEQNKEVDRLSEQYRDLMIKKGLGRGPGKSGVVTPFPMVQDDLPRFREWINSSMEELEKEPDYTPE